jgi:5-methyltetrahydrofolate--homocysteine methyltransferase
VVMKENLEEMNSRGISAKFPVILGGAALTRPYVEQDLAEVYEGEVRYARDAFEGLRLMDALINVKRGVAGAELPALRPRRVKPVGRPDATAPEDMPSRSDVATDNPVPEPPFWGSKVVKGVALQEYASLLDERATFMGQWGLKSSRASDGPSYEELVETEGRPRMRYWLDRLVADQVLEAAVVYGYFPCYAEGNTLVVLDENAATERARFTFPRQRRERRLCIADFFKPRSDGLDVIGMQLVTVGQPVSEYAEKLRAAHAYRDYFEVHGLSVQLTEALAEHWHRRVRSELVLPDGGTLDSSDPSDLAGILATDYRGCRYSFGYPACPDLEDRTKIAALLGPERIGVELTEEYQLVPEQSTDAIIVHHPEASYFNAK